jgi:hypothetical protein
MALRPAPTRHLKTSYVPDPAKQLRATFDELVQWMVQDASLDR